MSFFVGSCGFSLWSFCVLCKGMCYILCYIVSVYVGFCLAQSSSRLERGS